MARPGIELGRHGDLPRPAELDGAAGPAGDRTRPCGNHPRATIHHRRTTKTCGEGRCRTADRSDIAPRAPACSLVCLHPSEPCGAASEAREVFGVVERLRTCEDDESPRGSAAADLRSGRRVEPQRCAHLESATAGRVSEGWSVRDLILSVAGLQPLTRAIIFQRFVRKFPKIISRLGTRTTLNPVVIIPPRRDRIGICDYFWNL